jgi:23S rRNA (pseudouridine1915-N3)-methyltransferase
MKITLIVLGKTDEKYLEQGISMYIKRINHYIGFEIKVVHEPKSIRNLSVSQQSDVEGELILSQINRYADAILLDEKGLQLSSIEFARIIEKRMIAGTRELTFIIGGPYGFSQQVRSTITNSISLSRLTFSHQMVRLFFLEQLYRAFTIIKGEPYHNE